METNKGFQINNAPHTLRDVLDLSDNPLYKNKFEEVESLSRSLHTKSDCVLLPCCAFHDVRHYEAVERYLDRIIWEAGIPGQDGFDPTPEEAMYLLAATWLHDIGILHGIDQRDNPEDLTNPAKVMGLYYEHELRTVRYLLRVWEEACSWSKTEKTWLTRICACHRRHRPISILEPFKVTSIYDGKPVRLVILTALLRLADACSEIELKPPGPLMELYKLLGILDTVAQHWQEANLIAAVDFDCTSKRITLTGKCPEKLDFDLSMFNLREIIEIVRQDLMNELQGVQDVLLGYRNVCFTEVRLDISRPPSLMIEGGKQYLAMWPYLLNTSGSSTEATAALAQMLLFVIQEARDAGNLKEDWQKDIFIPLLEKIEESHPFEFLVKNLHQGIKSLLVEDSSPTKSAEAIETYLNSYMQEIRDNIKKIAEFADDLVSPKDVLMVYGYCRDIAIFLENLRGENGNLLYVVEYCDFSESLGRAELGHDENERVITLASRLGFQVTALPLASVPEALSNLRRQEIPCRVLLGTYAFVKSREFICKLGSRLLALAVSDENKRGLDGKVIVFVEKTKLLTDDSDEDSVKTDALILPEDYVEYRTIPNIPYLKPKGDSVSEELVDLAVTENGILEPAKLSSSS